ncbi:MAG: sugar ABC transporter substrate-binding protein [Thermoguttaceae bacterium]|jgi:inositol transport system substrate-binding protein
MKISILSIVISLCFAAGCGKRLEPDKSSGAKPLVIGVSVMNMANEYIVSLNDAMTAEAKKSGVQLIVNDAQRSAERQVQQVETFVAERVDAIILNPCEVEASSPAVDKAIAAGIPIVNVNSETQSKPTAFVGSHDEESARLAMGYIAGRLKGKGEIVIMHGYMGQAAQLKRDRGAREVLAKYTGLHLLAEQTAEWDRAKAVTLMENWLQTHGDTISAVFAQNDEMAMGALLAIEQAKKKDQIIVVGVDAIGDAIQAVKNGRLDATVFQDAAGQGVIAVDLAAKLARKQTVEQETYIPFQLVTKDNVDKFVKSATPPQSP